MNIKHLFYPLSIAMAAMTMTACSSDDDAAVEAGVTGTFQVNINVGPAAQTRAISVGGNDDHTLPMMALGALGVVSVASNLVPEPVAKLCDLCLADDYPAARALFSSYAALFRVLFIETNPIPVKAAMAMRGLDSGRLRLPLTVIDEEKRKKLKAILDTMEKTN